MKKTTQLPRWFFLMEGVLLAGLIWLVSINRTDWIIRMGIRQADAWILFSWILFGVFSVVGNLWLQIAWRRDAKRHAKAPIQLTFAPDKVMNPTEIRQELLRFQTERPRLAPLLDQGIDQLDNIYRKQIKMREILQRNEIGLLSQASAALSDAEQTLCRKLALVLNRALLCDPQEENTRRKEVVFAEHEHAIQVFLTENEDVLNRCEKLLTETVRYVEEKKAGRDSLNLEIMTDVIHSLTQDGIRMDIQGGGSAT